MSEPAIRSLIQNRLLFSKGVGYSLRDFYSRFECNNTRSRQIVRNCLANLVRAGLASSPYRGVFVLQ